MERLLLSVSYTHCVCIDITASLCSGLIWTYKIELLVLLVLCHI